MNLNELIKEYAEAHKKSSLVNKSIDYDSLVYSLQMMYKNEEAVAKIIRQFINEKEAKGNDDVCKAVCFQALIDFFMHISDKKKNHDPLACFK